MKQRNTYFDFLRGIAIIMVVAIHTFKVEDNIAVRQILNTAVPIFIAISGFFISQKNIKGKSDYLNFLKKQIPRVYIPTLFWSIPWLLLAIRNDGEIVSHLIYLLVCGYSIYYFIAYIIQCYIALPVISSIERKLSTGGG